MDIAELIEIALANSDERRVEVAALEPAEVNTEAVGALTQIVTELVENAISFSEPEDRVRVTGLHDQADYLISISDRGVGIPEHLMSELNRLLEDGDYDSSSPFGISLVARLASRHDIQVRLVPGAPGTTARVTVPARLVGDSGVGEPGEEQSPEVKPQPQTGHRLPPRQAAGEDIFAKAEEVEETLDLARFERAHRPHSGVVAMTEEARRRAEAFLEKVFVPLAERPGVEERRAPPRSSPEPNGMQSHSEETPPPARTETTTREESAPEQGGTVTALRVRVPGENFSPVEDDASTVAAEAAIDIRSALSRYAEGRRSAESDQEDDHSES
ncbi:MAG: sensor histidine kinase [Actinomycetota bacterium]